MILAGSKKCLIDDRASSRLGTNPGLRRPFAKARTIEPTHFIRRYDLERKMDRGNHDRYPGSGAAGIRAGLANGRQPATAKS